jgi:hypothetical protein
VSSSYGQQRVHEPDQRIACDIDGTPPAKGHFYAREEQKCAEEIKRPVERFNESDTNADHHAA